MYNATGRPDHERSKCQGNSGGHRSVLRELVDLGVIVIAPPDDQSAHLVRELQRLRTRATQMWPMPEKLPDDVHVIYCEYARIWRADYRGYLETRAQRSSLSFLTANLFKLMH